MIVARSLRTARTALAAGLLVVTGCASDRPTGPGNAATIVTVGPPASVAAASLTVPTAEVATEVQTLPSVLVRDKHDHPVAGVPVSFAVESGGGTITNASAVTDARGMATVGRWTLGTRSGPQTLRAQLVGLPEVILTVNAVAAAADVLRLTAGIEEITEVGRTLAAPPRLSARDRFDNPVAGRALDVQVTEGGGFLRGEAVTNDAGIASLENWVMGPVEGLNAVNVSVDGLTPLTIYARAVPVSTYDIKFRYLTDVTPSQRLAFERAAARWRKVIVGDLPNVHAVRSSHCGVQGSALNEVVDDLIVFVQLVAIDGPGKVLGSAGPCTIRSSSGLSAVGAMRLDVADVAELEASDRFDQVVLHEVGHILGIGTLWETHELLVDAGAADPYYIGVSGRAAFESAGGASYAGTPVPVENTGGSGTRDGHWRESVLNAEVMTGFVEPTGVRMPLSLLTIGALEDFGYEITTWGDDPYSFGSSGQGGISARTGRLATPDRELIEVPFPPPEVVTTSGQSSPISARIVRPARSRRVPEAEPRPVQQLEVRRER